MGIRAHLADTLVAASGGLAQDVEAVHGVGLVRHLQGQGPGEGHPLLGAGGLIQDGGGDDAGGGLGGGAADPQRHLTVIVDGGPLGDLLAQVGHADVIPILPGTLVIDRQMS